MGFRFLIFLFVIALSNIGVLHAQKEQIQWFTYSENYQTYIPIKDPGNKVSFFLDLTEKNTALIIESSESASFFLEDKLLCRIARNTTVEIDLDSLADVYKMDSAFVSIYNSNSLKGLKTFLRNTSGDQSTNESMQIRAASAQRDFYLFGFVFVLMIAAIVRLNASAQSIYLLSFRQIILSQVVDNPFYSNSFFSRESIRFYAVLAFAFSLIGIYFSGTLRSFFPMPDSSSFWSHIIYWVFYTVVVYLFFYAKFLLYKFLSGIYNFRRYTLIQNYDFMRVSVIVSVIYFLLLFVDLFLININLILLWLIPLVTLLIYIFTTYKKLNKVYSHTKLHLFSYLCVSEMVPWIFLTGILGN